MGLIKLKNTIKKVNIKVNECVWGAMAGLVSVTPEVVGLHRTEPLTVMDRRTGLKPLFYGGLLSNSPCGQTTHVDVLYVSSLRAKVLIFSIMSHRSVFDTSSHGLEMQHRKKVSDEFF